MKMFRKVVAYLRFFVSRLLRQSKTVCKACELCLFSGNRTICLLVTEDRYLIVLYVAHQVREGREVGFCIPFLKLQMNCVCDHPRIYRPEASNPHNLAKRIISCDVC
jgi:hypothetical protein